MYSADTKRKVEQISEELKNLDEILSKDDKNKELQDDKTDENPAVHSDEPPLSESETKGQHAFDSFCYPTTISLTL